MTIGFRIFPNADRPDTALVEALSKQAVSHLSDSMARSRTTGAAIRPMHAGSHIYGPALTVRVAPGDHLMAQKAIDLAEPGDVIVVDAGGRLDVAIIGGIMSAYAESRGIGGFVIDGPIRDAEEIAQRNLPVFARAITARGPNRNGPGEINIPVVIDGMIVHPGDIVVGDRDGIVAVSQADAREVLAAAQALASRETMMLEAIASGRLDRTWIDTALRDRGCAMS